MNYADIHPDLSVVDDMANPLERLRALTYIEGVIDDHMGLAARDARELGHDWHDIAEVTVRSEPVARRMFRDYTA
jgi:hypothetical protein